MPISLDTTNSLILLSDLKSYLGVPSTSTGYDTQLTTLINAISHQFNTYTNRKLRSRNHTTYIDGPGNDEIYLDQYPVTSKSTDIAIYVDTDRAYGSTSKIGSTSIILYPSDGRVVLDDDTFDKGKQSVKVQYSAGYTVSSSSGNDTGTMPHDLRYAAYEACRFFRAREDENRVGLRSASVEGQSISYDGDLPWSVKKILDNYVRPASR